MPDRSGHARQHRTPPAIRRPRVPAGERLVRQRGWLTSDHPQARWFRIIDHSDDWGKVRLQVADAPDADAVAFDVIIRPDGYIIPQRTDTQLGAEAIRIIGTAIRAGQRTHD
jgi:hypothetical protein